MQNQFSMAKSILMAVQAKIAVTILVKYNNTVLVKILTKPDLSLQN